MPAERLSMRTIKEVLRLKWGCGLSHRAVAGSCGIGCTTAREYVQRAVRAGLSWPLPEDLGEEGLERLLFPPSPCVDADARAVPDWPQVHRELQRKGVTLLLVWEEYKAAQPQGYQYSRFCDLYRAWRGGLDLWMRQEHKAGEKLFVDYAGQTMPVVDRKTGEVREAQIFVAVLGASNYTFAEATWTQALPDWIVSHTRAFAFFNGVTEILVPDNLRSGVSSACRYEPDLNPTYAEMARHFGVAIVPARVRKPKDKAKVEVGVQGVERRILAPLRNRTFFSLAELNEALSLLLEQYNRRPFQKLPGSRRSMFEAVDKPALKPLPAERYEYAAWKQARVNIDYHIDAEGHYYSVPYTLAHQVVDVRITTTTVECFHKGSRVASHLRDARKGQHTTVRDHMPKSHQQYLEWSPQRLIDWAAKTGTAAAAVVERILIERPHPEQGYRSCLGIQRLGKEYGAQRLEAACARALALNAPRYTNVKSILEHGLDQQPLPQSQPAQPPVQHDNVRGPEYYQQH